MTARAAESLGSATRAQGQAGYSDNVSTDSGISRVCLRCDTVW
jgi:hypothetical protein